MTRVRTLGTALGAMLALFLLGAGPALAQGPPTIVPDGFSDTGITNLGQLEAPTSVQFVGGVSTKFFVAEKRGVVLEFDGPNDPSPTTVIDLRTQVVDFGDRGLLGMALAPSFANGGGDMYLLFTVDAPIGGTPPVWHDDCPSPPGDGGCVVSARLVRVPVDSLNHGGTPEPLIQNEWCQQFPSHSIGTVRFGPDGMLYVGAGDGASYNAQDWGQFGAAGVAPNPCHDPFYGIDDPRDEGGALRSQDVRTDGDPAGLDGAILRVDPATGAAAPGNPFYGNADPNKARVIAYGFRNPYRFTFRPGTNDIWAGDVGWFTWEEINKVRTDSGVAANYGWPCYEQLRKDPDYNQLNLCQSLPASQVTQPVFAYEHTGHVVAGDGCNGDSGSSLSGMTFNSGTNYPTEYDGALFFTDYARNCIWFMRPGASGDPDPSTVALFARGDLEVGGPVDLQVMPNGNIAYVFLGWNGDSQVREIRWNGPKASLTASKTTGTFPYDVHFDASGSTGDSLTYRWDLDGDGDWDSGETAPTADKRYDPPRRAVTVRVEVTDSHGASDIASVRIAGTNAPTGAHITPTVPSGGWAVGDPLHFQGSAADPDGDPLTYKWTLTILHCMAGGLCHSHPYTSSTGAQASFTAPDHEWPSRLKITLEASDGILTSSTSMELMPRAAHLTVRATPSPLKARLGGAVGTSLTKTLIAGSPTTISAASPQTLGGLPYTFVGWSDGNRQRVRIVAPRTDTVLTARFQTPPASLVAPAVAGRARTDTAQTSTNGSWRGNELGFTRRWLRCNAAGAACAPIAGASGVTYQPGQADAGHTLRVIVTAANLLGRASAQSAPTGVLSDKTKPGLRLAVGSHRKLGNGVLPVRVVCTTERCHIKARALIQIKGRKARATKSVKKTLRNGKKATLRVRLSKSLLRSARDALDAGRSVKARLEVTATDAAGNRTKRRMTVRLR